MAEVYKTLNLAERVAGQLKESEARVSLYLKIAGEQAERSDLVGVVEAIENAGKVDWGWLRNYAFHRSKLMKAFAVKTE